MLPELTLLAGKKEPGGSDAFRRVAPSLCGHDSRPGDADSFRHLRGNQGCGVVQSIRGLCQPGPNAPCTAISRLDRTVAKCQRSLRELAFRPARHSRNVALEDCPQSWRGGELCGRWPKQ